MRFSTGRSMSADITTSVKPLLCVVDDDSLLRDSTSRLLRSYGFRVKTFGSGEQFWISDRLEEIACLILDVRMPGMSGFELQSKLSASRSEIPVIFITAYEDEGLRAQAFRQDIGALLIKPFSDEALLSAINHALIKKSFGEGDATKKQTN
jgi:FixJ family two-component response regulator